MDFGKLKPLNTDKHVGFHIGLQTNHLFFIFKCGNINEYPHIDLVMICGIGNTFL
jgi:hypothetical protein